MDVSSFSLQDLVDVMRGLRSCADRAKSRYVFRMSPEAYEMLLTARRRQAWRHGRSYRIPFKMRVS